MYATVLENEDLKCKILPELGGKVISIYYKKKNFEIAAQVPGRDYFMPDITTPFEQADASGMDDAFPTITACKINYDNREVVYTDHGTVWRSCFAVEDQTDTLVSLIHQSKEYPYCYKKKLEIDKNRVIFQYEIENTGEADFPCLWTMHGLVRYEEDMRLIYPEETAVIENAYETSELGKVGDKHSIEKADYDFYGVPSRESVSAQKYYVAGKVKEGHCGYVYPSKQVKCEMHYDKEKLPYLGFWVTAGGFRGDYNCALEPSNGYYDGVETALANKACYILKKNERLEFQVELIISDL